MTKPRKTALAGVLGLTSIGNGETAFAAHRPEVISPGAVRLIFYKHLTTFNVLAVVAGLFLATAALAMVRSKLLTPVLGWAALVSAATNWIAGTAGFYMTTYQVAWRALGLASLLGFLAGVLVVALILTLQREPAGSKP